MCYPNRIEFYDIKIWIWMVRFCEFICGWWPSPTVIFNKHEHYGKDMTLLSAFRAMEPHDSCKLKLSVVKLKEEQDWGSLLKVGEVGNSNLFGRPPSPPWHLSLGQSCDGLSVGDVMCGGEELDAARDFVWHYSIQTPHGCCATGGALRV